MLEQHFLKDIAKYKKILDFYNLSGMNVLEIGCGHGEITNLLLEAGAHVTAYEPDSSLTKNLSHKNLTIINDFFSESTIKKDLKVNAIISNPPYSCLNLISCYIKKHKVKNFILMSPLSKISFFPDSKVIDSFRGDSFNPPSKGVHYILVDGLFKEELDW